ncbi:hypothetical protein RBU61_19270 [Tissierella sp. MB52-C2]|nr:hypothetical protein [Tissierella sp. MB52-C2]WMM25042.1 hypothetical protein RBU61_19270 [Tissierella sp. MB52-C2]
MREYRWMLINYARSVLNTEIRINEYNNNSKCKRLALDVKEY